MYYTIADKLIYIYIYKIRNLKEVSSNAIAMKWSLFSKIKEEETTHQDKRPSSLKQEQHMAYTIKPQIY